MISDTHTNALATLESIGIINAGHRRRALADPDVAQLHGLTTLAEHLIWILGEGIVSESDLRNACVRAASTSGEESEHHDNILAKATDLLDRVFNLISRDNLEALRAAGLLTQAEHDLLLSKLAQQLMLATPAAAFAWIDYAGQLPRQRVLQLRRDLADPALGHTAILSELLVMDQQRKTELGAFWRSVLPGPPWLWITLLVLGLSFLLWKTLVPAAVPACTSPEIRSSLSSMMLRASIDENIAHPLHRNPGQPTVGAVREAGYASETRVRGCLATLTIDDEQIPYAYTIARDGKQFTITGASPAIVAARFGHLDGDGKFINNAAPIGRAAVESVFRARVDQMTSGRSTMPSGNVVGGMPRLAPLSPERSRDIAEIEPIAPCREIKAGLAYSCRLLVERNDGLMAALGWGSSREMEGDFTFQRTSATGQWTMSDQFEQEYVSAVSKSRLKTITQ